MMVKQKLKFIITLILLFCFTNLFSQEISLKKDQELQINHLLNKYIIDKDKIVDITKPNKKEYQNQFLGNIKHADVSNPLRLLLFFNESNSLIYLNQELSLIGEIINFDEIGNIDALAICSSVTNGFWLFNRFTKRLEYYNEKLQLQHASKVLDQINTRESEKFELQMHGDNLYLNTPSKGILVFDIYGTYIKTLAILEASSFQIINSGVLYSRANKIELYEFESLRIQNVLQTENEITYARLFNSNLYYIENKTEKVLSIKKLAP